VVKKGDKYKNYKPGDHIHILVTKDFAETATEFFMICKDEHFNPSEIIRSSMAEWVTRQKELQKWLRERNISKSDFMKQMAEAYEEAILYKK
jgi:ABC-type proline/glycine betaine transport system substrate-binding protein